MKIAQMNNVVAGKEAASNGQQDLTEERVLITLDTDEGHTRYNVYLDKAVSRPSEYRNLTEFLFQAKQGDKFRLYLNGPGGHMDSCVQLIHALANTQGETEAHLLGEVNSAHSNIFMACDNHIIYPYSMMMVHTFSGGFGGKGHDSARASIAYNEMTANLYGELYDGFLSPEELEKVLVGNQDLYFHGADIAQRIGKVYAIRDEIIAEQQRAEELASREQIKEMHTAVLAAEAEEAALEPELGISIVDNTNNIMVQGSLPGYTHYDEGMPGLGENTEDE